MKKNLFILPLVFCLASCGTSFKKTNSENYPIIPLLAEEEALDYSKDDNWMYKQVDGGHEVDLVYFYPTVGVYPNYMAICKPDDEMKRSAKLAFDETGSCFASYTNVFAPYYTQLPPNFTIKEAAEYLSKYKINPSILTKGYLEVLTYTHVRTDVYAAMDYYFEHFNNGRPFVLAGHSQGSAACQIILSEYMKVHPEYLSRMVVTYSGGFSTSKDYLEQNPHLKYASGEIDTGVIVSWNVEAPGASGFGFGLQQNSICINPLNWKLDSTYASSELNKGMLKYHQWLHNWEIVHENLADAVIDLDRGTILTSIDDPVNFPFLENYNVAGDKSYHTFDYAFYYVNLKENCKKRIEAFLGREVK